MDLRQIATWSAMPVTIEQSGSAGVPGIGVSLSLRIIDKEDLNRTIEPRSFGDVWNLPALVSQGLLFNVSLLDSQGSIVKQFNGLPAQQPRGPESGSIDALRVWQTLLGGAGNAAAYVQSSVAQKAVLSAPFHTLAEALHKDLSDELFRLATADENSKELESNRNKKQLGLTEERELFAEVESRLDRTNTIDFALPEWNKPPACYTKEQWEWGILRFVLVQEQKELLAEKTVAPAPAPDESQQPRVEFHQLLASLSQYPSVARHFGLMYDILLPSDALSGGANSITHLKVEPQWPASSGTANVTRYDLTPRTKVQVTNSKLQLLPLNAPYLDGFLDLAKQGDDKLPFFKLHQIDPNLKAARSMTAADQKAPPPALSSVGIALVWPGLGTWIAGRLRITKEREKLFLTILSLKKTDPRPNGAELEFAAEDLTRGYAVDVQDSETSEWNSLNQRVGTYDFGNGLGSATFTDEGWVSTAGSLAGADKVVIRDALFWWSGWSLAAQRPGNVFMPEGEIGTPDEKVGMGQFMSAQFKPVDNSLKRLRFGKRYRFRLRLVDLVGNRISLGAANQLPAPVSEETIYGRFEPVISPPIIPLSPLEKSFGETVTRLVVRSSEVPSANSELAERWIFPPQSSPFLAESHGMFDAQETWGTAAWDIITAREESLPQLLPSFSGTIKYLPDPMACNSVVKGLPFGWKGSGQPATNEVFKCAWTTSSKWYDCKPWLLRLSKSNQPNPPAIWDNTARTLTVFLPPGQQACLSIANDIACHPADIFRLPQAAAAAEVDRCKIESLCTAIAEGCGTGLTPCAVVELVHATQRPPAKPAFVAQNGAAPLAVFRQPNQTYADFEGSLSVHAPSTGSIEIRADWDDWIDKGEENFWDVTWKRADVLAKTTLSGKTNLIGIKAGSKENLSTCGADVVPFRHVFHDTSHRVVKYQPIASSRNQSCFDPTLVTDFDVASAAPLPISIPSSAPPPPAQIRYAVPVFARPKAQQSPSSASQRRVAHAIRIYLERKWFVSGADECVGVVLRGKDGPVPKAFAQSVSAWGQDPVQLTGNSIGELTPEAFENRVKTLGVPDLVLREQVNAAAEASLAESYRVRIVPHNVTADKQNNCWFTDVLINGSTMYAAFVRLAIVRYQPHSLPGMEISEVKLVDYVQLLPDRVATVTTSGAFRVITVAGPDTLTPPVTFNGSERRVVEAGFEWAAGTSTQKPDAFAWQIQPVSLAGPSIIPGMFRLPYKEEAGGWTIRVAVPAGLPGGPGVLRQIAIREYELYDTDEGPGHRLMYAEVVPLS
jgi:hypothetical protein